MEQDLVLGLSNQNVLTLKFGIMLLGLLEERLFNTDISCGLSSCTMQPPPSTNTGIKVVYLIFIIS